VLRQERGRQWQELSIYIYIRVLYVVFQYNVPHPPHNNQCNHHDDSKPGSAHRIEYPTSTGSFVRDHAQGIKLSPSASKSHNVACHAPSFLVCNECQDLTNSCKVCVSHFGSDCLIVAYHPLTRFIEYRAS